MWWHRKSVRWNVFWSQMGDFVRALHEEHGVIFHLEDMAGAIDRDRVSLKSGGALMLILWSPASACARGPNLRKRPA